MRLYYYRAEAGNFGDDLNLWMWPRLVPDLIDVVRPVLYGRDDGGTEPCFIGIGTLLNDRVPEQRPKYVLGSGAGYGPPPRLDRSWHVYGVRGPLSARRLGLSEKLAVGDAAYLLRGLGLPAPVSSAVAFVPHHWSCGVVDWAGICHGLGIRYIDPRDPVETVLAGIAGTRLLLAEAMHGAIVADALRVPWVPLVLHDHVDTFKWRDFCAGVGLAYEPRVLRPGLYRSSPRGWKSRIALRLKLVLVRRFLSAAAKAAGRLSARRQADAAVRALADGLERLRRDAPSTS